ncbi:hypothetical protein NSZ01_22550 [Nocardioides szechwanensis]|uniref:Uncharacterized protein n=1 Tax=Nocardioides szechwanensis TaxID=1005944 RepID=A0A1H0IFZ1_9ACTN|nr:hypothetical protein [Nocardioides szechwanensis]GEP34487.1 hypothetical protein NSZ01_22550 [Nocardioides szechwanensis]SDO29961.1 hypothetical protein SAMN05192576_3777 [Nocardioides szechwanensis]
MPKQKASAMSSVRKLPKTECCVSKSKCGRCPLRMLKEGTLPSGYTVKKRKLVTVDGKKVTKKKLAKAA